MTPSLRHFGTPLAAATLALAAYGGHRLAAFRVALTLPGSGAISLSADWRPPFAPTSDYRLLLDLAEGAALEIQAQVPFEPEPM